MTLVKISVLLRDRYTKKKPCKSRRPPRLAPHCVEMESVKEQNLPEKHDPWTGIPWEKHGIGFFYMTNMLIFMGFNVGK